MAFIASTLILAGVFIASGASKALHPQAFHERILDYRLVSHPLAAVIAWWLPWLEMACGAALLLPSLRRGSLVLLAAMLVGFIAVLSSALIRGLAITCGCFGDGGSGLWWALVADVGLLALLAWLWRSSRGVRPSEPTGEPARASLAQEGPG